MATRFINFHAIDIYREAVDVESQSRDFCFTGENEYICGVEVAPLTFRHWVWLSYIQNPFIAGGRINNDNVSASIAGFMLAIWPQRKSAGRIRRKLFLMRVGRLPLSDALAGIWKYIDEAFLDAPKGGSHQGADYFSFAAAVVNKLCSAYGMGPSEVLDTPVKVGFQCLKLIGRDEAARAGKPFMMFNPISDSVRTKIAIEIRKNPTGEWAKLALTEK